MFDHKLYTNLFERIKGVFSGDPEDAERFAERITLKTIFAIKERFSDEWILIIRNTPLDQSLTSVNADLGGKLPKLIGKIEADSWSNGIVTRMATIYTEERVDNK